MPLLFKRFGLVFMPGERALFKADEKDEGQPCTIIYLLPPGGGEFCGYSIKLDTGDALWCGIEQITTLPEK